MSTQPRIARLLVAPLILCLALMIAPMSANATTTTETKPPAKVSVNAELLDAKVKVKGKARIKGRLDVDVAARAQSGLELVVVQYLSAGVWVNLAPARCYPNSAFRVSVSFSVAAEYTLRVYHPATTLYAAAYSNTFLLAVIR